jgi:TatD DNase family protein
MSEANLKPETSNLSPSLVDTHAHIYYDDLYENIENVLIQCEQEGIHKIYMPNVDSDSIEKMLDLESRFPEKCVAMMGLHPCSVKDDFKKELQLVEDWLEKRRFAAVGEIGIDYYWTREFDQQQEEAFIFQLDLALKHDLPVSIHSRDSIDKVIEVLEKRKAAVKGVLHCFTGNVAQGKRLTEMGLFLGIGGVVTFKNSGLDKVVSELDIENFVLETDSPYLAPVPFRGKPNSPAYLKLVAQKIAEIKTLRLNDVAEITTRNAVRLFGEARDR